MNSDRVTLVTIVYWTIAGMGLHIGWGLIQLLIDLLARAVR